MIQQTHFSSAAKSCATTQPVTSTTPLHPRPPPPRSRLVHPMDTTAMPIGRLRNLPDLNFDILLQIVALLTRQDAARLTRTCRALRLALSAELPREGVTLAGRHLTSFLMFASGDSGGARLSYFRKLVLPGSTYDASLSSGEQAMSMRDVKRALSDILKLAAHSLESLFISDLDAFSFRPFELKKMLDSLPGLRDLELSGIDKKYENALVDTLPRLHTLTLAFLEDATDASPFLKASQNGLQAVTLYNGTLKDATMSFPTVHTLRVCPVKLPGDVDAYTRIFPDVRHVTLDFPRDYASLDPAFKNGVPDYRIGMKWSDSYVQQWRDRLLSRPLKTSDAWPNLQTLRAAGHDADKLNWAGLTRQVARLEICCSHMHYGQLEGILNELRPPCVVFHPSSFDGVYRSPPFLWTQLGALQGAPFVTRLTIVMCRWVLPYTSHPSPRVAWLKKFVGLLEEASISCLLIRLDFEYPASEERSERFEKWRAAMTLGIPSLRVLLFQVGEEVVLGWEKKEHVGGEWKDMDEDARRKFPATENMCPASIEPCEDCESRSNR